MNKNLHAYRNLGVACLIRPCGYCERATTHSVYFEFDAERRKVCSLGCCDCGRGAVVSEALYEELYELSFEFDRYQNGELAAEAFEKLIPDSCGGASQPLVKPERTWACSSCGEKSPDSSSQCWNCGYEDAENDSIDRGPSDGVAETAAQSLAEEKPPTPPAPFRRADLPVVRLRNRVTALFGTGIMLACMLGIVFFGVSLWAALPEWMSGGTLLGAYLGIMGSGLGAGFLMSYKRFPRTVVISPSGIVVETRGNEQTARYEHESVSRVNYGEGAKYLTIWFSDGKTFVVEADSHAVGQLQRYFGEQRGI